MGKILLIWHVRSVWKMGSMQLYLVGIIIIISVWSRGWRKIKYVRFVEPKFRIWGRLLLRKLAAKWSWTWIWILSEIVNDEERIFIFRQILSYLLYCWRQYLDLNCWVIFRNSIILQYFFFSFFVSFFLIYWKLIN